MIYFQETNLKLNGDGVPDQEKSPGRNTRQKVESASSEGKHRGRNQNEDKLDRRETSCVGFIRQGSTDNEEVNRVAAILTRASLCNNRGCQSKECSDTKKVGIYHDTIFLMMLSVWCLSLTGRPIVVTKLTRRCERA